MLDFHCVHTISNGVDYYKTNISAFKTLFNDVSEDYATTLYDKLNTYNISFNNAHVQTHEKYPLITTKLTESSSDNIQVLNNRGFNNNKVLLMNQNVEISIFSQNIEVLRVLHRIIQASMLNFKKNFLEIGYLNIEFVKSAEYIQNNEIISDTIVTYERKLIYNAQKQLVIQPIDEVVSEVFWATVPTIVEKIN